MLLEKLSEYADRLDMPPSMYAKTTVKWYIDIDMEGNLKGEGFTRLTGSGKRADKGKEMLAPHIGKTVGIVPKMLAENGEYVLGIAREGGKAAKVQERHLKFKELTRICAERTNEPTVQAVVNFLERWDPDAIKLPKDFRPSDVMTFRVDDQLPIHLSTVQSFWASYTAKSKGESKQTMQCLICGETRPVEERQPMKIKGVPGDRKGGIALISANEKAFESYGLEASLTAPTCRDCGERFHNVANALISGENSHLYVGPIVYIFWTRQPTDFSPVSFFREPDPEDVKALLESAWKGQKHVVAEPNEFYATAFSASGGRLVVRDWLETTVEQVRTNLTCWFRLQRLVDAWGEEGKPLGIRPLSQSLYRRESADRDMVANVPRTLLRCALFGTPLPDWLTYQAIRRNRAGRSKRKEEICPHSRMALIKMVLLSQQGIEEKENGTMERLDVTNREPAYLCGRLLAELEAIQRVAVPRAKATIIDRYFGTASSAPATVFGQLLRGCQSHLSKLRKEKEGAYYSLQSRLEEIMTGLTSFPSTLSLREQALFSLGYYHQRADDRASAASRKQANENEGESE